MRLVGKHKVEHNDEKTHEERRAVMPTIQRPEECSSGWSSLPSRTAAISNDRKKCIGEALLVSSDEE